jgi:hypothetical protein
VPASSHRCKGHCAAHEQRGWPAQLASAARMLLAVLFAPAIAAVLLHSPVPQPADAWPHVLVGRAQQLEDVQQLLPLRVSWEQGLLQARTQQAHTHTQACRHNRFRLPLVLGCEW